MPSLSTQSHRHVVASASSPTASSHSARRQRFKLLWAARVNMGLLKSSEKLESSRSVRGMQSQYGFSRLGKSLTSCTSHREIIGCRRARRRRTETANAVAFEPIDSSASSQKPRFIDDNLSLPLDEDDDEPRSVDDNATPWDRTAAVERSSPTDERCVITHCIRYIMFNCYDTDTISLTASQSTRIRSHQMSRSPAKD